jgi:DNA polymerase III epsilon subunit family exonuclease
MFHPLPAGVERALARMRAMDAPVPLVEVARQLLAADRPVEASLAREVVAAVLGHEARALPDTLDGRHLRPAAETRVAEIALAEADFIIVDLETTGISADRDVIIEIGAVRVASLAPVDSFETLIRPAGPGFLPKEILELTGINEAMLRAAPTATRALGEFRRWLDKTPNAPFVAHNASFDARFTQRAFEAHAIEPLRVPVLCTCKLARRILPTLNRYNLDHLCAHYGISNRARHRALGDADATARALIELIHESLRGRSARTVGELLDLQKKPTGRRRRR